MGQKIPVHDSTLKFNQACLITINFFEYYIIIYSSPFWRLITYSGAYLDTVPKSAVFFWQARPLSIYHCNTSRYSLDPGNCMYLHSSDHKTSVENTLQYFDDEFMSYTQERKQ